MGKKYLFESSKPESVKRREAAARKKKRSEASRKGWEKRRRAAPKTAPKSAADRQLKNKIRYLNQRLRRFGDPDHLVALLPWDVKTDTGFLSVRPEALKFFRANPKLLNQIQAAIRKHPVSNDVRDAFENMLHDIYDQITEIGHERFFEIIGKDFEKQLGNDADTNAKMQDMIDKWKTAQAAIPAYYEEQIRGGKLTPYSD